MRQHIATLYDLFQQRIQDLLIVLQIHQLAQPDQVAANKKLELLALLRSLLSLPRMSLVLQPHPQLVHLDEVGEDEADRVLEIAFGAVAVAHGQMVARLPGEIVSQEQAANGVLYAAAHLHHVLHDLLDGRILNGHVHGADSNHEVEAGDNIAGILHKLVQVGEVVHGVVFAEIDGEMAERIEDGHVQFVVLLGSEAACPKLGNQCGAVSLAYQHCSLACTRRGRRAPALEGIHELAWRLQAPPHHHRLLAHHTERIFQEARLVFYRGRRRHCEC